MFPGIDGTSFLLVIFCFVLQEFHAGILRPAIADVTGTKREKFQELHPQNL